ncbi:hypothetical protein PGN35_029195 [Nodosilinea sp. PGN35]|uniref:hypothetical protein n=1 Tax=Nodosilinea sp. PGN35 TaxID=3020489 RepID=UPI0023B2BC2E|nr:hypothetical protein [Nodosilinea sp. TSF1-S3]MDF0368267.1 hypothetical protein [Nodosilinea sp. TSF1-S3]
MQPQDPNFPPEIPSIPPPRRTDAAGLEEESGPRAAASGPGAARDGDRAAAGATPETNDSAADPAPREALGGNGRPSTPDSAPWTDSDLQDVEDPLPVPTPEPPPTYVDRRQMPRATPDKNAPLSAPAEDVWADTGMPYQPKELGVVDQLLLLLAEGVALGKKGLRWLRSQLPSDLQRQLSDEMLAAIVLGLLMLLLALWNPLGAGQSKRAVASEPLPTNAAESGPEDRFAAPAAEPGSADLAPAVEPAPAPTAEQTLIADIQTRVSRISRSYGAGLIQSVEVNLPGNTLGVNVAEAWYGLLSDQQNEIAQDIYAQAQGLQFGTLQLRDPAGVVVARNPVVGSNMVILRRLRSVDGDWRTQG